MGLKDGKHFLQIFFYPNIWPMYKAILIIVVPTKVLCLIFVKKNAIKFDILIYRASQRTVMPFLFYQNCILGNFVQNWPIWLDFRSKRGSESRFRYPLWSDWGSFLPQNFVSAPICRKFEYDPLARYLAALGGKFVFSICESPKFFPKLSFIP